MRDRNSIQDCQVSASDEDGNNERSVNAATATVPSDRVEPDSSREETESIPTRGPTTFDDVISGSSTSNNVESSDDESSVSPFITVKPVYSV